MRLEHPAGWICAHYKSYYYWYDLIFKRMFFLYSEYRGVLFGGGGSKGLLRPLDDSNNFIVTDSWINFQQFMNVVIDLDDSVTNALHFIILFNEIQFPNISLF